MLVDSIAQNNTPAHCAAETGKATAFNCLLQHGADLEAINTDRDTPLDMAKKAGHPLLMEKACKHEY